MSLINEALKRAKEVQPDSPRAAAAGDTMQPVHYRRPGLPWFFFPILAVVLGGGCWFWIKGWDASRQAAAGYSTPIVVKAREPIQPEVVPGPSDRAFTPAVNTTASVPYTGGKRTFSLDDGPGSSASSGTPATSATPEAATAIPGGPTFKLQGIFFRNTSPSALVNGKSLYVGDRVSGARVKAIERDSVTLEYEGQMKTLTLE